MYLFSVSNNSPSDAWFYGWCETMISGKELSINEALHHLQLFFETVQEVATCNNGKAFSFTIHNRITKWGPDESTPSYDFFEIKNY
jgi:hypothetical protein